MPFTAIDGTGFEPGHISIFPTSNRSTSDTNLLDVSTSQKYTGVYGLMLKTGAGSATPVWARWAVTDNPTTLYVAVWFLGISEWFGDSWGKKRIYIDLTDGNYVALISDTGYHWDAYRQTTKIADGSIVCSAWVWNHIEIYVDIAESGTFQTRINGTPDIDFSGDTRPATTSAIAYVRPTIVDAAGDAYSYSCYIDDMVFGSGDWPGDIRFTRLMPNADTAQKDWVASSGSINYAMIDEVPPSDSDYVSTGSINYKDLYEAENWAYGATYTPLFLVQWIRAKKDTADNQQIASLVDSGGVEDSSGSFALTTSYAYYSRLILTDPDGGGDWTNSAIDAMKIGQEAFT